ncbi:penicillin acylase family protein [Lacihabitans sp. LS3-19]|uniref:penicillin acylase family protein n=1 Tax=Lacihabitans sp. LS3-19 TaxID=2487335 RepID=UPI0020CC5981|nr:penicillin acylase family protein [Lacihabitans sp. LS3-19]MCP9768697.1 penicillin acylase family protein [Lacihabitans sp. LS3-19]
MNKLFLLILFSISAFSQKNDLKKISQWEKQADNVIIKRDQWGIPHVEGKTDADAVFGLMYAQCEDDFARVEINYLEKLGRLSEVYGEKNLYNDLQIRMLIDEQEAKEEYKNAEPWLKKLLNAHADGINYFLYKNPSVKPKILNKFEPWYPLLWTDGSIGAISTADLTINDLEMFYGNKEKVGHVIKSEEYQQTGSNGFAIAPQLTSTNHAMLYINPHTTFYFRPEVHIKSKEGLNTYGAVTWGQFFIYQGFNEYCGWMHTSSNADVSDTYIEHIEKENGKMFYKYEGRLRPLITKNIAIKYIENGIINSKTFETYATHHGPIMAKRGGNWISLKSYNRAKLSLVQSWIRTKAKGMEDYKKAMDLKANTSNNTVFADKFGNIAYWHGNYMPIRDTTLNWAKPQDGTVKETEYKGLHSVEEVVHMYNPENGWIQNCNSTPFTVSGKFSPRKSTFPEYMAPDGENFRGVNANRLLETASNLDLDKLIKLGYDNYLPAFEVLIPSLKKIQSPDKELSEALEILKNWDYRTTKESVATTLAIEWAQKLSPAIRKIYVDQGESDQVSNTKRFVGQATEEELLNPLKEVLQTLNKNFGTWKVKWGEINRFQRLNNSIPSEFDDNATSLPMGNASALWGCLPSFNSRSFNNSIKRYGYSGNSFVCAVEFGDKVKAKSLLAGGNSSDVNSKNFNDQAEMFTKGEFKDVLFYAEDIEKNTVRKYNPGK